MSDPVQVENVVNGRVRAATEYRDAYGWRLPVTTDHDVSHALKCVRVQRSTTPRTILESLAEIGREATWIGEHDLRAIASRTGSPIRYLRESTEIVNRWLADLETYVKRQGLEVGGGWLRRNELHHHGGLTTTLLLAGDEMTLAPWAIAHAVLADTRLIIKTSSTEPLSAYRFVSALLAKGIHVGALLALDTSSDAGLAQIQTVVANVQQSIVFGEDQTIRAVYGRAVPMPPHKPVPYWSGRSGAIVLPDADLEKAAAALVFGAAMDRGNKCTSTKKVFAPAEHRRELERLLTERADVLQRGDPLDERTDIGFIEPYARKLAEAAAGTDERVYDRDLLIVRASDESKLLREELPYPVLAIRYYTSADDPVELANATLGTAASGRALAMSVFTRSRDEFSRIAARLAACKVLHDKATVDFDCWTGHQSMHLFLELMRVREEVE